MKLTQEQHLLLRDFTGAIVASLTQGFGGVGEGDDSAADFDESFFRFFYVSRQNEEEKLREWMDHCACDVGIVGGVQGSGKTTLVRAVLRSLDPSTHPHVFLNTRQIYDARPGEDWYGAIDNAVQSAITDRFFPVERINKHIPYLLYRDQTSHLYFHHQRDTLRAYYEHAVKAVHDERHPRFDDDYAWFQARHLLDEDVRRVYLDCIRKATLHQYFSAATASQPAIERFVVVLDNVDRLPLADQLAVRRAAEELFQRHRRWCNVLVTTRRETADPDGFHNGRTTVIIFLGAYRRRMSDRTTFSPDEFISIVERRAQAFLARYPASDFARLVARVSHALCGYHRHRSILQQLSNQSVRDALSYHGRLVAHLVETHDLATLDRLSWPESEALLQSHVYGWIAETNQVITRQQLNPVDLLRRIRSIGDGAIVHCDLGYLVLVAAFRFQLEHGRNPSVGELVQRLEWVGYEPGEAKRMIVDLWQTRNQEFGNVLTLLGPVLPDASGAVDEATEVEVNYRGLVLARFVVASFTYLARLLYDGEEAYFYPRASLEDGFYEEGSVAEHAPYLCRFLYRLADAHMVQMSRIAQRHPSGWWRLYKRRYCVGSQLQIARTARSCRSYLFEVRRGVLRRGDPAGQGEVLENCIGALGLIADRLPAEVEALAEGLGSPSESPHFAALFEKVQEAWLTGTDMSTLETPRRNISVLVGHSAV